MDHSSNQMQLIQYWLSQGQINTAKGLLNEIIKGNPKHLGAKEYLALIYEHEGNDDAAIELLLGLTESPECSFTIHFNIGELYLKKGNPEDAIRYYLKSLDSAPPFFEVLHNLGLAYAQIFQFKEAVQYFEQASQIDSNSFELQVNWGAALKNLGQYSESLRHLELAEKMNAMEPSVWLNKGVTLDAMNMIQEAINCYEKAITLKPNYLEAYCNKANSLHQTGKYAEAMETFKKALSINSTDADTLYNLSLLQLASGDYQNGWKNYEFRWLRENAPKKLFEQIPTLSNLTDIKDKKILVWSEQGLGDSIQFCRYLIPLINRGAKTSIATHAQLIELFKSIEGIGEVLSIDQVKPENYEAQISLLSLPLLTEKSGINTSISTPYLHSNPDKTLNWKNRLQNISGLKVGLVWNGGYRANQPELWAVNARRNIALKQIAKLNDIPGVEFFSLQKGEPSESELMKDQAALWPKKNLHIYTPELITFEDTASFIENLDLVISVDTSTAHLAGAIGKPVWILNRFDSCWRWLIKQERTHWYPTVKIFNQPSPLDWDSVIAQVKKELINVSKPN